MDIWKILEIEPVIDKKIIKRAYAAKTKEIHPEEKPEEFKQLHEAYQAALGYADYHLRIERIEVETAGTDETSEESGADRPAEMTGEEQEAARPAETAGEAELISYLGEQQEKHKQRIDAFTEHWKEFTGPFRNPEVLDWWKEYLSSEEFQEIKYHPQVLHLLAEEIDHKFLYGIHETKLLFWDAYGFKEDEGEAFQGDQRSLYKSLYPAYAKREKQRQDALRQAKYDKALYIFLGIAAAAILAICVLSAVNIHDQREKDRLFLLDYMAKRYPQTTFSEPERLGKDGFGGNIVYGMRASLHPELSITAMVESQDVDGEKAYLVTEDYGQQLFEYYAVQYGLEAGMVTYTTGPIANYDISEYSALFYSDIEEIDAFCETVERMFREQEELHTISEVAVCTENVLFPEILIQGGVEDFPFADLQVYASENMDAAALSAALREAYMLYMFQYESWNITTAQYREWGAAYEKISGEWEDDDGEWHEVYDPATGEYLCKLFIPTYESYDGYYSGERINIPKYTRRITVGSAYYFLLDREADLSVNEDGSRFQVRFYGDITDFGEEPEENFYELKHYY